MTDRMAEPDHPGLRGALRRSGRTGPFADLVVTEVGQFVVGPFCGQFLADGGARVIKVESLLGDPYRHQDPLAPMESRQFALKNRGKESLPLKLGHPGAAEVLRRLVAASDILIVNARPATLRRHGLTYEQVSLLNPRLIHASASAFGTEGPEAAFGGMDVVAQARAGLLFALGAERDALPYHSEVQAADYTSAVLLLAGIGAALHSRAATGRGQHVHVCLIGGALTLQNNVLGHFHEHDGWREDFLRDVLPRARKEHWPPSALSQARRELRPDPRDTTYYRVFRTSDGMVAVGAGSPAARASFLSRLGVGPDGDPTTARAEAEATMRQRSTAEWLETLRADGVPVSEVSHVDEVFFDDHFRAEGLVQELDHPALGRYVTLGTPIKLSGTPFVPGPPSPGFAAHARGVLAELGFDDTAVGSLVAQGAVAMPPGDPFHGLHGAAGGAGHER